MIKLTNWGYSMKKLLGISLLTILSFNLVSFNVASAHESDLINEDPIIESVDLNTNQIYELQNLGFEDNEISSMTEEEYINFKNLDGELTEKEDSYYKVVANQQGDILESKEISEKEAENLLTKQINGNISLFATNTKTTGLLKMTLTSSKLSNGQTLLKNSYKWSKAPNIGLEDVVALTHSASAVKISGSVVSSHKYSDNLGVHTVKASATTQNSKGVAKTFDVKVIGAGVSPYDQHGYISVKVEKGNKTDVKANAYGHYVHVTLGITGTISLSSGSISVGGASKKTYMDDTMIDFNY